MRERIKEGLSYWLISRDGSLTKSKVISVHGGCATLLNKKLGEYEHRYRADVFRFKKKAQQRLVKDARKRNKQLLIKIGTINKEIERNLILIQLHAQ